jgi:hypothetical protein
MAVVIAAAKQHLTKQNKQVKPLLVPVVGMGEVFCLVKDLAFFQ